MHVDLTGWVISKPPTKKAPAAKQMLRYDCMLQFFTVMKRGA